MKAIIISIKPKYVAKILNGEKTIEIRKTCPKQLRGDTHVKPEPIDVYIYCTKDEKNLLHKNCANIYWVEDKYFKEKNKKLGLETQPYLNGKVVAKFTLEKVEKLYIKYRVGWNTNTIKDILTIEEKTCVSRFALFDYLGSKGGYAWHIDNLEIFDEPKELSEFKHDCSCWLDDHNICKRSSCKYFYTDYEEWGCFKCEGRAILTKAPQSWQFIEVEE